MNMLGKTKIILLTLLGFFCCNKMIAQKNNDSTALIISSKQLSAKAIKKAGDTSVKYNPNKAIIRSALLPGWGQITNRKIWKAPIVWAALGITGGIFIRNIKQYNESKRAYALASDMIASNDYLIPQPYYSVKDQPERIRTFRNQVRQNVDYTVLFFLIFWGLNVADAAVDAHLKTFDVSDDLGLKIKAGHSQMANTNGVSLILTIR